MFWRKGKKKMEEEEKKAAVDPQEAAEQAEETPVAQENAEEAKPVDEATEWKEKYLRTLADFDNFRKRTARDREDLFKQAAADVIKDVLATADNLQLALSKAPAGDPFADGVKMVLDGLLKTLETHGAKPLDSLGEPLDPNFHQAVATLPSEDVEEGHVMTEVKKGWLLNGKLLREAQVVVSSGKPAASEEPAEA